MNAFDLKFFIYCRKSTEDEDRQILSIDAQLSELNAIARQHGLTIVETFAESKSAKEPGREVFNAMLRRIENGDANGVLSWKLDRLARIRQEQFAEEVKRNAQLVIIPDEWKERFLARIETWEGEESQAKQEKIDRLKAEQSAIKSKIDRINNGFADGSLDIAEFKELKNPLIPKKVELEQQIIVLEKSKVNRLEPLRNWVLKANQAEKWVSENNWLEMKSFLQMVGSNRLLRAQTLTVTFTKPSNSLAETNLFVRSTPDVAAQSSGWWSRGESNP